MSRNDNRATTEAMKRATKYCLDFMEKRDAEIEIAVDREFEKSFEKLSQRNRRPRIPVIPGIDETPQKKVP